MKQAEDAAAYVAAYRRYCWPVAGPADLCLAPFSVLARTGEALVERPNTWHLAVADRLVDAAPELFRRTERRVVALDDEASCAEATSWWEAMTEAGGEGMVVKPNVPLGRVQPGVKVRGREYLRITYGPSYLDQLPVLKRRSLGHKRSLAWREHALGVEALDRHAAGEPLWRVHECVAAILALESDPIDPRLCIVPGAISR